MEIDARGEVLGFEICEGIIRSARRMTYTQIQKRARSRWAGARGVCGPGAGVRADVRAGAEAECEAEATRGSIDFDLPEPVILFNPDGDMHAIVRSERGWSHRLIEEFMLSANECVATWIEAQRRAEYLPRSRDAGSETDCRFRGDWRASLDTRWDLRACR